MLYTVFDDPKPEKYKDYKNRKNQQSIDKASKLMWQIKDYSLKPEDKELLRQKMIKFIQEFKL